MPAAIRFRRKRPPLCASGSSDWPLATTPPRWSSAHPRPEPASGNDRRLARDAIRPDKVDFASRDFRLSDRGWTYAAYADNFPVAILHRKAKTDRSLQPE